MTLRLPFARPYDAGSALRALAAHDVPGMQVTDLARAVHSRAVRSDGVPGILTIAFARDHVVATLDGAETDRLVSRLRRWLDLDADPRRVVEALGNDPIIGALVTKRPGLRVLGCTDGFEAVVGSVLGQQVSLAAGRTFAGRMVAAFGSVVASPDVRLSAFPTPARIAALTPGELQESVGLTGNRAGAVIAVAASFADGLQAQLDDDPEPALSTLSAIPGVGPWTLDQVGLRVLAQRDAFPAGDLVLRRALGVSTTAEVARLGEAWRPFRAYATYHLWTEAAYGGDRARRAPRGQVVP